MWHILHIHFFRSALSGRKQHASGWWCDKWYAKTCEFCTRLNNLLGLVITFILCVFYVRVAFNVDQHRIELRGMERFPNYLFASYIFSVTTRPIRTPGPSQPSTFGTISIVQYNIIWVFRECDNINWFFCLQL